MRCFKISPQVLLTNDTRRMDIVIMTSNSTLLRVVTITKYS
uniref:Uncharacterized protein n=1 Tax=Anguilla anguilla TaxID=7936 RepID=A0A0E9PX06_ANGAN